MVNKIKREITRINYKTRPEDRKINSVLFGFLSSLGVFAMAAAGTLVLGYFFRGLGYSTIVTLVLYLIFVLHFSRELKMERLFKRGYWIGSGFFALINFIVIVFGGMRWPA